MLKNYAENNPWKHVKAFWLYLLLFGVIASTPVTLKIYGYWIPISTLWAIIWYILYYLSMTDRVNNLLTEAWEEKRQ